MSRKRLNAAQVRDLLLESSSDDNIASNDDSTSGPVSETSADSDSSVAADAVSDSGHDNRGARGVRGASGVRRCRGRGRGRGRGSRTAAVQRSRSPHRPSSNEISQVRNVVQWRSARGTVAEAPPFDRNPSVIIDTTDFDEVDYFYHFVDDTLVDVFVRETNRFVEYQFRTRGKSFGSHSIIHLLRSKPVTSEEMKKFLALILLTGIVRKPEMNMYWSTNPLICTPLFSQIMTRNRFFSILKFWHFVDPETGNRPQSDKMYKIRPVIDHMQNKFQSAIVPEQNIALDEELLLFKGRLGFRQYMPLKRSRFGVKLFCVCESSTAYVLKFHIYAGKHAPMDVIYNSLPPETENFNKTDKLVIYMLSELLGHGHTVYMDNFYNNVQLAEYLHSRLTGVCGTMRKNRVPAAVRDCKLQKGESSGFRHEEVMIVKYADKKDVYVISTVHDDTTTHIASRGRRPEQDRPNAIIDYNKNMGGVDKMNQLLQPYDPCRKTIKWYRKVVIHLLHICMMNAWVLYNKRGGTKKFLQFQQLVIAQMIFTEGDSDDVPVVESLARLTQKHFPDKIPSTQNKARAQKRCRVCWARGRVRREVRYQCPDCPSKPGLCFPECFKIYHTQVNYQES